MEPSEAPQREKDVGEDATLVKRWRKGDERAFESLVRRHAGLVGNIAYNILGDVEAARDVSQEVFLKVHRFQHQLQAPEKFRSWLHGITRTTCIDLLRRNRLRTASLEALRESGVELAAEPEQAEAAASLEGEELYEKVLRVVKGLPRIYQEVVLLRHLRKLSYRAIAEFLDLPEATVESRLYRARLLLKERLGSHFLEKG